MTQAEQMVTISSKGSTFEGYLAQPEGEGPFPAIVVIHEVYGLNDNIKDIARRFAAEGYVALAVDLFAGRNRTICMLRFMSQLILSPLKNDSLENLKDALTFLTERTEVDAERLGAIGFCMGGGFSIGWACNDNRLKAIAPYYGANPRPLAAVERICPVVGSYPDKDFTTSMGQKLDVELDRYAIPHDIKVYPNTRHSFFNDQGKSYAEAASRDSWQRVLSFFQEHINAPVVPVKD